MTVMSSMVGEGIGGYRVIDVRVPKDTVIETPKDSVLETGTNRVQVDMDRVQDTIGEGRRGDDPGRRGDDPEDGGKGEGEEEEDEEEKEEHQNIVFHCVHCHKAIDRDSRDHDECITSNGEDWFCGDCFEFCDDDIANGKADQP